MGVYQEGVWTTEPFLGFEEVRTAGDPRASPEHPRVSLEHQLAPYEHLEVSPEHQMAHLCCVGVVVEGTPAHMRPPLKP